MLNTDFTLISCFCKEFWRYFDSNMCPLPILERFVGEIPVILNNLNSNTLLLSHGVEINNFNF